MREELMEAINRDFYQKFGISYDDFSKLDATEQQRIIQKCRRTGKRGNGRIMIGSGEHAVFIDKSDLGITPDKYRQKQEAKINQIIGTNKVYRKVLSLFDGRKRGY